MSEALLALIGLILKHLYRCFLTTSNAFLFPSTDTAYFYILILAGLKQRQRCCFGSIYSESVPLLLFAQLTQPTDASPFR